MHCKKRLPIFPFPAGMLLTMSLFTNQTPWRGIIISDIPAGDGKIGNLFLQVMSCSTLHNFSCHMLLTDML